MQDILVANGYISVPQGKRKTPSVEAVATVAGNLANLGFVLGREAFEALSSLPQSEVEKFWTDVEPTLKALKGADRDMDAHVVYKNFPREALELDEAMQVFHQMAIYMGIPSEFLVEGEDEREPLGNIDRLTVLKLADDETPARIFEGLKKLPNRWTDNQNTWARQLLGNRNAIVVDDFGFKENAIALAAENFTSMEVEVSTATDALRLSAALSDSDLSLREKVTFRKFSRPERRRLLAMLEASKNIEDDFAARPALFKRLMRYLRPNDYNTFPRVAKAYDDLYNGRLKSFSAKVDPKAEDITEDTLATVKTRAGEFARRFHHFYDLFGEKAVEEFVEVMDKLTARQLVALRTYLASINDRQTLIYPPKSNWNKAQVKDNKKSKIAPEHVARLDARISELLRERMGDLFPEGIALDPATAQVKLQTNDQKLAEYGRGTTFDIPETAKFIRSASYWKADRSFGTTWFDNGWNFFNEDWSEAGVCSWDQQKGMGDAAAFSGDPVNSKDKQGRACQVLDIYPEKLRAKGVRFAVWNVLCYSNKKFSEAEDVLATLQWGDEPQAGKIYEASRAQMVFPLKGEQLTSYVAFVDLKENKLVYMDAPLRGRVHSASANGEVLSQLMPAYVEYLKSLPSVHDLLRDVPEGSTPVLFSDDGVAIKQDRAFVFQPSNSENEFERVSVNDLVKAAE